MHIYITFKSAVKHRQLIYGYPGGQTVHLAEATTQVYIYIYSVLVSVSCPKALYHLESDNLFRITVVVADWLG